MRSRIDELYAEKGKFKNTIVLMHKYTGNVYCKGKRDHKKGKYIVKNIYHNGTAALRFPHAIFEKNIKEKSHWHLVHFVVTLERIGYKKVLS